MEQMRRAPGLMRRGTRWWLRVVIPKDLQAVIGKREHWQSLRTSDFRQAVELARLARVELDAELAEARRTLTGQAVGYNLADIQHLVRRWFHDRNRDAAFRFRPADEDDRDDALEILAEDEGHLGRHGVESGAIQTEAQKFMTEFGIGYEPGSRKWFEVVKLVHRAEVELTRRKRARYDGQFEERSYDGLFNEIVAAQPMPSPPPVSLTLENLIQKYQLAPERMGLSAKTKLGYTTVFRVLTELLGGQRPVAEISRDDCRRVQQILVGLPPNSSKRFAKLTLEQASQMALKDGISGLSASAINSYLNNLSSLLNWAVKEDLISKNPARGLRVPVPASEAESVRPFNVGQLRTIFNAPLYTGCENDGAGYNRPGALVVRKGRFWVPLLSLWTGMRLGECCQLLTADIVEQDGVPVILITDLGEAGLDDADRKRVKTKAGRRFVPVHPELQKIGFLTYASELRLRGERRLFPELRNSSDGYLSGPFSKWFNDPRRFLGKLGLSGQGVSFHSFRHSYRDALREADISVERVRALGGWTGSTGTEERYGAGLKATTLAQEIAKIKYEGLDLSHLWNAIIRAQ